MKYVVVTGGVVSGLGKGITISSLGVLLKSHGLKVTAIKIDPYLNTDAGTMSPFEHGEVYVLDDGGEDHNITTGKVYKTVIERERRGDYLGKTVQIIPHCTNLIQDWIDRVAHHSASVSDEEPDICLIELGGTVGDIESMVFLEALRQFQFRFVGAVGEQKTKPTQHSVKALRKKISQHCHCPYDAVLAVHDVSNIYHVPLVLQNQGCDTVIMKRLGDMNSWGTMARNIDLVTKKVRIALVGKYTGLSDSYLSVYKSLKHAAIAVNHELVIDWVDASLLEPICNSDNEKNKKQKTAHNDAWSRLSAADGILVPGGFGSRGVEGKIMAANYARKNNVPYFGICLGFQCMVIDFVRDVLEKTNANSTEFDEKCENPAIIFMPEGSKDQMGGTMRLGARKTVLYPDKTLNNSIASIIYKNAATVNPELVDEIESGGLCFTGKDDRGVRMEIAELPRTIHPFYFGCQYHPEFKSHPQNPSPPFLGFIQASIGEFQK
eukprot:GSMAST32.ASY1.ANO1.763.1 assembled CDS